jgi:hypothetical protein
MKFQIATAHTELGYFGLHHLRCRPQLIVTGIALLYFFTSIADWKVFSKELAQSHATDIGCNEIDKSVYVLQSKS